MLPVRSRIASQFSVRPGWRLAWVRLAIPLIFAIGPLVLCASGAGIDDDLTTKIEALSRLKSIDLEANPGLKAAVLKILDKTRGTPQFVEIVRDFKLKGNGRALLDYAIQHPTDSSGIEAFQMAVAELGKGTVAPLLQTEQGSAVVQLIGNSNDKELQPLLREIAGDAVKPLPLRKEAVRTLAHSQEGAAFLLELVRSGKLGQDVKLAASSELNRAPWPEIKKQALEVLPLPQAQNAEPLPPIGDLVKIPGTAGHGKAVFQSQTAACSTCHKVQGQGGEVGPDLSEIGTKLGKDAIYEAILDPSAGISFGYEAWSIELRNGDEAYGLITSETAEEITVKNQTGVVTRYKKEDVAKRQKSATSMMPAGLQLSMSTQDLVDLVEYLSSLKKTP